MTKSTDESSWKRLCSQH